MTSLHLVRLQGEYDISDRRSIDEKLGAIKLFGPGAVTVLDLSGVTYADSSLLGALIRLNKYLAKEYPTSRLCVVATKQIRRLFQVTGIDRLCPVFDDVLSAQQTALLSV